MQAVRIWSILMSVAVAIRQDNAIPSNSTAPSRSNVGDGTPSKDFRVQCDSNSLGLVQSQTRQVIYYLRGVCGGVYNDPHASRCSFLDLNMCYINDSGNIRALRGGAASLILAQDVSFTRPTARTC
ncbi:hypothetical protein K449DRAFT_467506 [Hypoxylon sp. EC38]|nr:hypothetical protein K449DRAFT_467506 [Hypoxylon sp. EC38]